MDASVGSAAASAHLIDGAPIVYMEIGKLHVGSMEFLLKLVIPQ